MPYKDKAQQSTYQNQWQQSRRRDWLDVNGPCVDCGATEGLEVDHVDPSQKVTHRVWSWSKERRGKELAKCVARCSTCHKERTREQLRNTNREHGIHSTYASGCRCEECRVAHRNYMRKHRNRDTLPTNDG